jgi:hypothetical protein
LDKLDSPPNPNGWRQRVHACFTVLQQFLITS